MRHVTHSLTPRTGLSASQVYKQTSQMCQKVIIGTHANDPSLSADQLQEIRDFIETRYASKATHVCQTREGSRVVFVDSVTDMGFPALIDLLETAASNNPLAKRTVGCRIEAVRTAALCHIRKGPYPSLSLTLSLISLPCLTLHMAQLGN